MNQAGADDYVALVLRILVGTVFVLAAAGKLRNPESVRPVIATVFPSQVHTSTAWALVLGCIEGALGAAMIVGFAVGATSVGLLTLLCLFMLVAVVAVVRRVSVPCGCLPLFGQERLGMRTIARNGLLAAATVLVAIQNSALFALDGWIRGVPMPAAIELVPVALIVSMTVMTYAVAIRALGLESEPVVSSSD